MADVFVSYKREDETRVARLVLALQKQGLSVWWDRGELSAGEQWRSDIETALAAAKCVVVVWTAASVGPQGSFVREEAGRGAARQVLVPVLFDKVSPPLGFGEVQAADLVGWRGSLRDPFFKDVVAAVHAKLEGRPVPPPQGPMQRLIRRIAAGSLVSALTVAFGAFASNALNLQNTVCGLPLGQPGLSDACGAVGFGARPTREERLAWEERPAGDCDGLRTHLRRYPDGAYRTVAEAMLNARTVTTSEQRVPGQRRLSLFVGTDTAPLANEAAARADALRRGGKEAERQCQDFAVTGVFEYRSAEVQAQDWNCQRVQGGWVCGLSGRAVCALDEKRLFRTEHCEAPPPPPSDKS